jgi:hypothetical protein
LKDALQWFTDEAFTESGSYFNEYFKDLSAKDAREMAARYKKQFESALKSINGKGVLDLATAFNLLNREVDKTPKKVRAIIGPF